MVKLKSTQKKQEFFKEQAARLYGQQAEEYALRDHDKWRSPSSTAQALEETVKMIQPRQILELGSGTGRYFPYLRGREYTGVDVCAPMLEKAKSRENILRENGFSKVVFFEEELEAHLQRSHERFDFIFSVGCIGFHVPLTLDLMKLLGEHLTPNGYLFLQTTQASWRWKTKEWLKHWRNRFKGITDQYRYFCSTNPQSLQQIGKAAGIDAAWIRTTDNAKWFDRPMLLSLFRKES